MELEDSLRFFALRIHDVGAIKSSPPHIIRESTDPRSLREIKKELSVFEIKSGACLRERLESELRR